MKFKRIDGSYKIDLVETDRLYVSDRLIQTGVYTAITAGRTLLPSQLIGGVLDINCTTASFAITLPSMDDLDLRNDDTFEFVAKIRTGVAMTVSFTGANVNHATSIDITGGSKATVLYKGIVNSGTLDLYRVSLLYGAFS